MIYTLESDIVLFIKGLVHSLVPYAQTGNIRIYYSSVFKKLDVQYHPLWLSQSVVHLICNMINLLPPRSTIKVRLAFGFDNQHIKVDIENTGLDLIRVNEVTGHSAYSFIGRSSQAGTVYTLVLPLTGEPSGQMESVPEYSGSENIPLFYKEIQKRLRSHFTLTERLLERLEQNSPHDAVFMQKINTLVKVNLGNENFDSNALCKAMFMSRTQLFRRMKSLVRQAPANYIKSIRLQKAKELLETTDLTISEVAYRTGFLTISHFTKIFKNQYGLPPSVFRRGNKIATNE